MPPRSPCASQHHHEVVVRAHRSALGFVWGAQDNANFYSLTWKRQTRAEVQQLIDTTDLGPEMRAFHLMESWDKGERGLSR